MSSCHFETNRRPPATVQISILEPDVPCLARPAFAVLVLGLRYIFDRASVGAAGTDFGQCRPRFLSITGVTTTRTEPRGCVTGCEVKDEHANVFMDVRQPGCQPVTHPRGSVRVVVTPVIDKNLGRHCPKSVPAAPTLARSKMYLNPKTSTAKAGRAKQGTSGSKMEIWTVAGGRRFVSKWHELTVWRRCRERQLLGGRPAVGDLFSRPVNCDPQRRPPNAAQHLHSAMCEGGTATEIMPA